jgi:RNA polymerase sigma factor (sigma-70 family)
MSPHAFDVFMCHSTADKAMVEGLAKRLKSEGLKPWLDKWNLVPGEPWQPEIENALQKCRSCAVFIGPASSGPWQNEEMRAAIARRVDNRAKFRVIPVLLPKTRNRPSDNLPAFLTAATWVDFRKGLDDTEALRVLICGIRGVPPGESPAPRSTNKPRTKWVMTLRASVTDVDQQVAQEILQRLSQLSGDATLTIRKITAGSVIIEFESTTAGAEQIRSLERQGLLKEVMGFEIQDIRLIEDSSNQQTVPKPNTDVPAKADGQERLRRQGAGSDAIEDLIRGAQQGDQAAFEQLVRTYDKSVLRLAMNLLGSQEEAQEAYQEAFLRVYRNLQAFRFDCSFHTWLYRIVTNICLDMIRKRRATVPVTHETETREGLSSNTVLLPSGLSRPDQELVRRFFIEQQPDEKIRIEMRLSEERFRALKFRAEALLAELGLQASSWLLSRVRTIEQ